MVLERRATWAVTAQRDHRSTTIYHSPFTIHHLPFIIHGYILVARRGSVKGSSEVRHASSSRRLSSEVFGPRLGVRRAASGGGGGVRGARRDARQSPFGRARRPGSRAHTRRAAARDAVARYGHLVAARRRAVCEGRRRAAQRGL